MTPSHGEVNSVRTRALWLLLAIAISALEALIPRIPLFPWLKPGFSNVITLLWIMEFGTLDAVLFSSIRVWISGYYLGFSFFSLGLALCGSISAVAGIGMVWRFAGRRGFVGTLGLGILGACLHNGGQLVALAAMFGAPNGLLFQVPIMLGASLIFGSLTGAMVLPLRAMLLNRAQQAHGAAVHPAGDKKATRAMGVYCFLLLAVSFGLLAVRSLPLLAGCAMAITLAVLAVTRSPARTIIDPLRRFWPLFLFIAFVNFLEPMGTFFHNVPFCTRESLTDTGRQCLRLWCWLSFVPLLSRAGFERVFFNMLARIFRNSDATLTAGAIALVCFGAAFSAALSSLKTAMMTGGKGGWFAGICHPRKAAITWLAATLDKLETAIEERTG